jgi:hypothetical protein
MVAFVIFPHELRDHQCPLQALSIEKSSQILALDLRVTELGQVTDFICRQSSELQSFI